MKQGLYLETSVIGAYLDNGEPFRRDLTIRWWEHEMPDYRTVDFAAGVIGIEARERAASHFLSETDSRISSRLI